MSQHLSLAHRTGLHPLAIAMLALPAMVAVLVAGPPWFAIAAVMVCLLLAFGRGLRASGLVAASVIVMFTILWVGMGLWLPREAATTGALRIVAVSVLLIVPMLFVNVAVLADTLIDRFRVPYRGVDAVMLGGRFAALMRQDFRVALGLAALRSAGDPFLRARLRAGAVLAVLIASFRHSEQLAVAMDARGFGTHRDRTVRCSSPVTVFDIGALAAVWTASVVLAVLLERM